MEQKEIYERLFHQALRIRMVEEKVAELYPSDKIQSPVHLSIGQEHIPTVVCDILKPEDKVFGTYRSHALYLAKGGGLNKMMAELFGKKTGCGGGKAGSMHLSAPDAGLMGTSAVVANTIPHAVGYAMAAKLKKNDQISVCFLGEGASGEGVYHESLNFAAKRELPVLFILENNDLAIYTQPSQTIAFDFVQHASSYNMSAECIENGMDLISMREKFESVIGDIRQNKRPAFLEIKTSRYYTHVGPGIDKATTDEYNQSIEAWKKKDPLIQDSQTVDQFKAQIEAEIAAAVEFAESSPFPDESDLLKDVR